MKFEDVENARKAYWEKLKKIYLTMGGIAVAFAIFALVGGVRFTNSLMTVFPAFFVVFFVFVVGVIVASFVAKKERTAYYSAYKAYFVERIMRETFTNLNYDHTKGLPKEVLKETEMVNLASRYNSNDLTIARYKNVGLVQADVHIEQMTTDSDGNTYYVTLFRGRFMFFEFPKKFNFVLELVGKRAGIAKVPRSSKNGKRLQKMKTESGEFNQRFKIFSEDGFEMFYILDPAFIEKIQAINDNYKGRVMFGFLENKLMVGLNDGKDSFEPPKPSRPIDEQAELAKNQADIKVITDFVDYLRLDKKLFQ